MSRPVLRFAAASLALFMLSRSAVLLILFELCLSGEKYFSFGQTLMSKTEDNAYGFNKSLGYHVIFPEGVASGKSVNRWDGSRELLRDESVEQSLAQQAVMQQLQYQEAVAKYLLFQSYEESE